MGRKYNLLSAGKMKKFFEHKFITYNLFFDVLVLTGTFFLGWNQARILSFYWIDICVQVFFYILYMRWIGHLRLPFKLIVSFSLGVGIMMIYLYEILNVGIFTIPGQSNINTEVIDNLFKPYYEITFFLVLSGLSNIDFYKKLKRPESHVSDKEFFVHLNCALSLLVIPAILILSNVLYIFTLNVKLSLVLAILFLRNRYDSWKNKNLRKYI